MAYLRRGQSLTNIMPHPGNRKVILPRKRGEKDTSGDFSATIDPLPAELFLSSNLGLAGYRDETERLADAYYVGHDETLTLKRPGVDPTPTGMTINGNDITIDNSFDNTLTNRDKEGDPAGWDFTGKNIIDNRDEILWVHCLFGPGDQQLAAAAYCIDANDNATSIIIRNCTGTGSERSGWGQGFFFCNSYVAAIEFDRNRLVGFPTDMIKVVGGPTPMKFTQNNMKYTRNFPEDTAVWDAGTTFQTGDIVTNGVDGAFTSLRDDNQGNALPPANGTSTWWTSAHADCINIKGNHAHGALIRGNLMEGPPVDNIGDSAFPLGFSGINRAFWITANGGETTPQRAWHIEFNVVRGKWIEAVTIYNQSATDVATTDDPHMVTDNTFVGTGGQQTRYLTLGGSQIGSTCFVENNRSYQTLDVFVSHGNTRTAARSNRAELALQGTSDAPNGAQIEARYREGASSGRWHTIATVSGGTWAGTLSRIPRSRQDFTAEARVVGSGKPAATTTPFAVGTVIWQAGASNTDKGTQEKPPTPPIIGLGAADQQNYFYHYWDHANDRVVTATINDDDPYTAGRPALRSMCAAAYHMDPDLRILFAFLSQSGSNETDALKDANTAREWTDPISLYDSITKFGGTRKLSEIDIWYSPENMSIHLTFTAMYYNSSGSGDGYVNGDDISSHMGDFVDFVGTGPAAGYNHSWIGLTGDGMRSGRIIFYNRIRQISDAINGDPTVGSQSGTFAYRRFLQEFWPHCCVNLPDHDVGKRGEEGEDGKGNDWTHMDSLNIDGFSEEYAIFMSLIGVAANVVPVRAPKFDIIQWNENWLRLGSTAGPITTWERQDNGLAATNFRDEGQQVLGFWDGSAMPLVSEIRTPNPDGSPGSLAAAGDVYIYPNSGTFTATSTMYWHPDKGYPGQSGTTDGGAVQWGVDGGYRHVPIVDLGLHIRGMAPDVMWEDMEFINNTGKEDLPETLPLTRMLNGYPSPDVYSNGERSATFWDNEQLTIEWTGSVDSGAVFRVWGLNADDAFGFFRLRRDNNKSQFVIRYTTSDAPVNCGSDDGAFDFDGVVTVRYVMDRRLTGDNPLSVRLWFDGVEQNVNNLPLADTPLCNGKPMYVPGTTTGGAVNPGNNGNWGDFRVWNVVYNPGDPLPPAENLRLQVKSDGNGGFVDHAGAAWPLR